MTTEPCTNPTQETAVRPSIPVRLLAALAAATALTAAWLTTLPGRMNPPVKIYPDVFYSWSMRWYDYTFLATMLLGALITEAVQLARVPRTRQ